MSRSDYALGHSEAETRRLIVQHQIYAPITRRFFEAAGIGRGMKVLDVGSGAGDVAMLAADLVGPRGRVVGLERNGAIVETARARAEAAGWTNVEFVVGETGEAALDSDFDAVVGRWVLMHQPDAAVLLRAVIPRVRTGGVVAFQENDFTYPPTLFPATDLSRRIQSWTIPPPGTPPPPEMRMGTNLYRVFLEAGLPGPELIVEAAAGGGPDWPGYAYVAETIRNLLPALRDRTGLDPREVDVDTLADRLRDECVRSRGIQMLPIMYGAWARTTG